MKKKDKNVLCPERWKKEKLAERRKLYRTLSRMKMSQKKNIDKLNLFKRKK
jgi:hypothetical protein